MSKRLKEAEEKELFQVVGHNCKLAREINGTTRAQLQDDVWGYENNQKHANRVSELESGNKRIELITLYRVCKTLGVSADFILGFSDDYERENLEAKTAGLVFYFFCSSVLEATDNICLTMSRAIQSLPSFQGEVLKSQAKHVVELVDKRSHDLMWCADNKDLVEAVQDLKTQIINFDKFFARQMRLIDVASMSQLESSDEGSNRRLTMSVQEVKTNKL